MGMYIEQIKNSIFVSNIIKMKRVVSLLFFALLLNGCDDGDLIQEDINFEDVATQSCSTNDILYKLKDKESLILEIPKTSFTFPTEPSLVGEPTIIDISTTNRLVYRFYNGTVSSDNICETIPPATPLVTDQWTAATGGKIQIFTTAVKTVSATDNSTKITGYNHNIVFKNVTFTKSNGTSLRRETFPFGDYKITLTTPLPSTFNKTLKQCPTSKQISDHTSSEALTLDIDANLLSTTLLNTPKTGLISDTTNKLTYRIYSGLLTDDYFCTTPVPATPTISQEWNAVAGVSNVSGIVEVTTTTNGTGFKHTIVLKKVTMKKGTNDFSFGDNYLYGELLTTN